MSAYYNEFDPFAAQWLRNLIAAGHIADGEVDDRSIVDVLPSDLTGFTQCHFFAGIGVWSHALRSAGWPDDRPVWTASLPCQPFSSAGKRQGHADERHLAPVWLRLVEECRPPVCFGEQVGAAIGMGWLDALFIRLEQLGYAAGAVDFPAASVGSPQCRQRVYWVAESECWTSERNRYDLGRAEGGVQEEAWQQWIRHDSRDGKPTNGFWSDAIWLPCSDGKARPTEPGTFPLAHGSAQRVGRLRAYGNAIVAPQAAAFIEVVMDVMP